MSIEVRDKFFSSSEIGSVQEFCETTGWHYGWYAKSHDGRENIPHWHVDIVDGIKDTKTDQSANLPSTIKPLWDKIIKEFGSFRLHRAYCNGHGTCDDGAIHIDYPTEDAVTFLTYLEQSYWNPDWGGETLVYDSTRVKVIGGALPQAGRLLAFPGRFPHRGVAPTKKCPHIRKILAMKAFKID